MNASLNEQLANVRTTLFGAAPKQKSLKHIRKAKRIVPEAHTNTSSVVRCVSMTFHFPVLN